MKITQMRRKDFLALPVKDAFKEDIGEYKSLVIIPTGKMHDSGFQVIAERRKTPPFMAGDISRPL